MAAAAAFAVCIATQASATLLVRGSVGGAETGAH